MKVIVRFIVVLFVLCSCGSSDSSPDAQIKNDPVIVYKYDTIKNCFPIACVDSVFDGRISIVKLMNTKGLTFLRNGDGYKILSFEFNCRTTGHGDVSINNNGPFFNKEIKGVFNELMAGSHLFFEDIKAIGQKNDTILLPPLSIKIGG